MDELFIQPVQFEKTAYKRVGDNPAEWTGNVMESFYNQFPYFANSQVSINFTQKDEQKGYAIGSISIQEGQGLVVPVIIKNRELFPFDVAIMNGTTIPLTNATLQLYAQSRGAFLRTVKPDAGDITNSLFNTSFSQQITPSYSGEQSKQASVLDNILPSITHEMKTGFFDQLQKNASIVEGFKQNGTSSLILKLASVSPTPVDYKEKVSRELDRDIHYIYKTAAHEWTMVLGNSKVADCKSITIPDDAAQSLPHFKTPFKYDAEQVKTAHTNGHFTSTTGRRYVIFGGPAQDFAELEPNVKIASTSETCHFHNASYEPQLCKEGMWYINGNFSDPIEVSRIWYNGRQEIVETTDGLSKIAYSRMAGIEEPYTENGITYIPADSRFIVLGERTTLEKKAHQAAHAGVLRANDGSYELSGPVLEQYNKQASLANTQDLHNAIWTLLQCGASTEDIQKTAQLKVGESFNILHKMNLPVTLDKVASVMQTENKANADRINSIAKNFIKEASIFNDVPTVDAVLSLNFVNKDNIREFANALPAFTDISQKLADMLLKTRIGVQIVDEGVIRRVMLGITEIIEVLSGISNLAGK